jgi:alanyl-tRNA synthetase
MAGDWSKEFCGGTHVKNTGEIGSFKIISENGVAAGVRRIEAVTGQGVLELLNSDEDTILQISDVLKTSKKTLADKVRSVSEELKALKKELENIKRESMGNTADDLIKNAKVINGIRLITAEFEDLTINDLRNISDDIKRDNKGIAMVFAAVSGGKLTFLVSLTDDVVEKGLNAGRMIKDIAQICGGGGGGKADMAQAGGKDPSKVREALEFAETLIK